MASEYCVEIARRACVIEAVARPRLLEGALLVRAMALVWLMYACHHSITRGSQVKLTFGEVGILLRYGGWVTIASLFNPVLYMIDRLTIGVVLNAVAVTVYEAWRQQDFALPP